MRRLLVPATVALLLVFAPATAAFHKQKPANITHTVTGTCTVTQTLTLERVSNGETVTFEFLPGSEGLGEASWASYTVTSRSGTFSLTREFTASENGRWVAHAELFYSNAKPAYESYLEVMVIC